MDPDAALGQLRKALAAWGDADHDEDALDAAQGVADAARNLDGWLTQGGALPAAWEEHRA